MEFKSIHFPSPSTVTYMTITINPKLLAKILGGVTLFSILFLGLLKCAEQEDAYQKSIAYPATVYCPNMPPVNIDSVTSRHYSTYELGIRTRQTYYRFSNTCNVLRRTK